MGLLASIVAYLSVVAAIVVGFLMSADALLYHSHHRATNPRPEIAAAAKLDSSKTKKAARPSRNIAEQRAIPRRSIATEYRRKTELSRARGRPPHPEAQRRYWALRRDRSAPLRAMGYAEEPQFSDRHWR